jgi:hypothetical protein
MAFQRVAGEHHHAVAVADFLCARVALADRLHRRVLQRELADPVGFDVVQDAAIAVDHVQVRTVAVVMLAEQALQDAALAQVDGAADVALVLALRVEDGVRNGDQQAAGSGLIRIADVRLTPLQGFAVALALEHHALQRQAQRRGSQDGAGRVYDQHRVEAVGLQLQAGRFGLQLAAGVRTLPQPRGGVGELLLRGQYEVLGTLGQLAGIHPVGFQRVADQLLALHAVAGMQGIGQCNDGTEQGQGKDQLAQVEAGRQQGHDVGDRRRSSARIITDSQAMWVKRCGPLQAPYRLSAPAACAGRCVRWRPCPHPAGPTPRAPPRECARWYPRRQ